MEQATLQSPYAISEASRISLYPLFFTSPASSRQMWIVGLEGGALAIELPEEGVRGIQHLQAGKSLAETAAALQQEYGEPIDTVEFVQQLADLGFVERVDSLAFPPSEVIGQRWVQSIPSRWISWLYSRPALATFGGIILLGPLLLLIDPAVRPHSQDLLWSSSYALDIIALVAIGPALLLKHELGHLLAARAKGLSGELTFGHRLLYLVAVSRIGGIWKLGRFDRLVIYCAGMASDCVTASICLLIIAAPQQAGVFLPGSLEALLRLIALSEYLGIAWEFQIFLKTDVYHIVADLTNRHDLPQQMSALLRSWQHSLMRRRNHQEHVRVDVLTLVYLAISLIGISGSILWGAFYLAPATVTAIRNELMQLGAGMRTTNIPAELDSIVALAIQSVYFLLLGWSIIRTHHSKVRYQLLNREVDSDKKEELSMNHV